ncbi:HAD superfamily hydrolase (TIGR01509 family)/beta-phosphoglucomutase family hydrolase [Rhodococcus sp. OK519]|uniref:HAD family hydrolase n=1 Tax=Rhodococcus sp. OK519 TaxID=2135729 RepID=UPI000D4F22FC|nr:HAD superfamily hydrolase (TIGR01509 family)/beta-phosphoglucomutase family hydrolase [Rhodococcus sp. OK519]
MSSESDPHVRIGDTVCSGFLFDMDGVVTDTARVHERAWARLFDEFLDERGAGDPHFTTDDYLNYVDGRPRVDGVASFLASRSIDLAHGAASDPPDANTVCGLAARKDALFLHELDAHGVDAFPGTVALIGRLREAGVPVALVTASRNAERVLTAAGLVDSFDARVDGIDVDNLALAGKPDPATYLEGARRLGLSADRCVVLEDAIAGVEAGRRGGFGVVVGVDRTHHADALRAAGADVVVSDLGDLEVRFG